MSVGAKIKGGFDRVVKSFKVSKTHIGVGGYVPQLSSRALQHRNPFIERGEVGRNFLRVVSSVLHPFKQGRVYAKLASSDIGRKLMTDIITKSVQSRLGLKSEEVEGLKAKLTELSKNPNLRGRGLANAMMKEVEAFVRQKVAGTTSDPKQAKKQANDILGKIHRDVSVHVLRGLKFNKNGDILDLSENKLYLKNGEVKDLVLDPNKKEAFNESMKLLKAHEFKTSIEDYVRIVESNILVNAIKNSDSVKEAFDLYVEGIENRMKTDETFKKGFMEFMRKDVMKTYNAAAAFTALQESLIKLPSYLASTVNKMLSQAVRRLPIVGDIAAIQYEAGAALSEIGDKLSEKVEASSQLLHNLGSNLTGSNIVKDSISESLGETVKETQEIKTATPQPESGVKTPQPVTQPSTT